MERDWVSLLPCEWEVCIDTELSLFLKLRTVLSSVGNDGRVRLWKQTVGGVWRTAGVISVEQSDERGTAAGDVEME